MKIFPLIGVDDIHFKDDISLVQKKLGNIKYKIGQTSELGVKSATIHVADLGMHIVFNDKLGSVVESIEISQGTVYFNDIDLLNNEFNVVKEYFKRLDNEIKLEEDNFSSSKFGVGINCDIVDGQVSNYPTSILVFSEDYLKKEVPTVDDIIKHYLKK